MENKKQFKILIVDDEQGFVTAIATFLKGNGYQVVTAFDATFAMRCANRENVDLVLLDLGFPAGGGFFVLGNLRKLNNTALLPVIVSTANVSEGIKEKVLGMGANDFLPKPYELEVLLAKIRNLLPQATSPGNPSETPSAA